LLGLFRGIIVNFEGFFKGYGQGEAKWHKNTNAPHFLKKFVILGFFAGKSHDMIGHGISHGDLDFCYLHEKSLYLLYYEIFPQKILKSRTFKKCGTLIVKNKLFFKLLLWTWGPCLEHGSPQLRSMN